MTYTLTYQVLPGGGNASNAILTDILPEGVSYVSNSSIYGGSYDYATNTITWPLGSLEPILRDMSSSW